MLKHSKILALAMVGALAPCAMAQAAKPPVPGYSPLVDGAAGTTPVHIVATNTSVRPQLAFGYTPINAIYSAGGYPGMSMGQSVGVDVASGIIASALINGALYAEAKGNARDYFEPVSTAGCALAVDAPMHEAIIGAVKRSHWGAAQEPVVHSTDGDADDLVDSKAARQLFSVSTSLSPDMSWLMTSLQIEGFVPLAEAGERWQRKAAWQDRLIVVSPRLTLPPKSDADRADMLAREQARYAASGTAALIAKVNAARGNADRRDRAKANEAARLNKRLLKEARQADWTPRTEALRRSQLWSENECAGMQAAITGNAGALSELLDGLYSQTLPPPRDAGDITEVEAPAGQRTISALPGGGYLSSIGGDDVQLGFRYALLKGDD